MPIRRILVAIPLLLGAGKTDPVGCVLGLLGNPRADVRIAASRTVGQRYADVPSLAAKFAQLLREDADSDVREEAAKALGQCGQEAGQAALTKALEDRDADVRMTAAFSLVGQRTDGASNLVRLLEDGDPDVRLTGVWAVWKLHFPGDSPTARLLLNQLKNGDSDVRQAAARALGLLGIDVGTALLVAIEDGHSKVREAATWALAPRGTIPECRTPEWDKSSAVREAIRDWWGEVMHPAKHP